MGQGEDGLAWAFALVSFALVVGAADRVWSEGGEGGAEHGAFEALVAGVGGVLASDRGARSAGEGGQAGCGRRAGSRW